MEGGGKEVAFLPQKSVSRINRRVERKTHLDDEERKGRFFLALALRGVAPSVCKKESS